MKIENCPLIGSRQLSAENRGSFSVFCHRIIPYLPSPTSSLLRTGALPRPSALPPAQQQCRTPAPAQLLHRAHRTESFAHAPRTLTGLCHCLKRAPSLVPVTASREQSWIDPLFHVAQWQSRTSWRSCHLRSSSTESMRRLRPPPSICYDLWPFVVFSSWSVHLCWIGCLEELKPLPFHHG